jgi:hypothetical protein
MPKTWDLKKILLKFFKIIAWTVASVIFLLLLIAVAVQIPAVQNKIVQEAVAFLHNKIKTEVQLKHVSISFPKKIVLEGLYLEDQSKDTLVYAGKLSVDTDLWALTKHRIQLNDIALDNFRASVSRAEKDSAFNFDYIIDAFNTDTATVEADTSSAPWQFDVRDIDLTKIKVDYRDALTRDELLVSFSELSVGVEKFDLVNEVVHVDDIVLKGLHANVAIHSSSAEPPPSSDSADSASAFRYDIAFQHIQLEDINARYTDTGSGQSARIRLKESRISADDIELQKRKILLDEIFLGDAFVVFEQLSSNAPPQTQPKPTDSTTTIAATPWIIQVNDLQLQNNNLQYHDYNQPFVEHAVDFNHLWIGQLAFGVKDFKMEGDQLQGEITGLSFRERSGLRMNTFQGVFALDDHQLDIHDFILRTENSRLALDAKADFTSLDQLATSYQDASLRFIIKSSFIGLKDVLYFQPALMDSLGLKLSPQTYINIEASMKGKVDDLTVDYLRLKTLHETSLDASGKIVGLPEAKNLKLDLHVAKLHSTRSDLQGILPKGMLPSGIQLPEWLDLKADVKGSSLAPRVKAGLFSNLGEVRMDAAVNFNDQFVPKRYRAKLNVDSLHVGTLMRQQEMGKLTLTADVNGEGTDMKSMVASAKLVINSFDYNQYRYKNLRLDSKIRNGLLSGTLLSNDENLDLDIKADLNYQRDIPLYKVRLDLKNADFRVLRLTDNPLRARATLDVNMATDDFKILNGNIDIRNVAVFNGKSLYMVDSLLFASIDQKGRSEISLRSDILSGDFKGTINIFSLPEVLKRHFNHYFALSDTVFKKPADPQNFEFSLVLKNTDLLTEVLIPDLEPFVPGEIAGEFNSAEKKLNLRMNIAKVKYGSFGMDSVGLKVLSNEESFDYTFYLNKIAVDTLRIEQLKLAGNIAKDSIHTNLIILDSLQKEKYFIGGVFNSFEEAFQFRFIPGQITLNYDQWDTPLYNTLRFTNNGLVPNNFMISKGDERILLLKKNTRDSTLSVSFDNVKLDNITNIVEGTTPVGGLINGDVNIGVAKQGAFNSSVVIRELTLFNRPWGDLWLQLGKTSTGPFNVDVRVEGQDAMLQAAGYITSTDIPEIHFKTSIERFNIAIAEPLTLGQLKKMSGNLTGEINVNGKTSSPEIEGAIHFKKVNFLATYVNTSFSLVDESINIKGSDILLNKFTIRDEKNNNLEISGSVRSQAFTRFDLDLSVVAKNFQLLHTTEKDNDLFYGNVMINTRAKIGGTSDQPRVQMNVSLSDDSNLTYIVPQSEKGVMEQKGIVVFVDKDAKQDPFLKSINPADTVKATFSGIDLTANIELSDKAVFNVVIDPATGDKLSVQGNSTLAFEMDPSGDMQLSGRYEISQGSYHFSFYKLIKRDFQIEKGSTITWSGDPMNADMNIRAIFKVETSPMELISGQSPGTDLTMYKERLPFLVYLQIKGELLMPEISFQLDMPQDKQNAFGGNIYARIKDINTRESDLNKQVFSLLVLKRFMADNPLESGGGGGLESTARSSVSRLLTDQLNRLSQNIKGVQLTFDVKSYDEYSSGAAQAQTQLQLGLSKSMLNNRLVVKVSGNVGVEGEASNQSSFADYIGDLALEYKVTDDGRLRITGFRNSNYDMIDGELIETGAGLIYIKDYDTLKELFRSNAKDY